MSNNLLSFTFVSNDAGKKVLMEGQRVVSAGVVSKVICCCQIHSCLLLGCFMLKKFFKARTPSRLQIILLWQTLKTMHMCTPGVMVSAESVILVNL